MPIIAVCSKCGKSYRFLDKRRGQALPCKKCGNRIIVPSADLSTIEMSAFEPDGDENPESPSDSSIPQVQLIDEQLSEEYEVFTPSEPSLPELSADYIPSQSANSSSAKETAKSKRSRRQSIERDDDAESEETTPSGSGKLVWIGVGVVAFSVLAIAAVLSSNTGPPPKNFSAVEPGGAVVESGEAAELPGGADAEKGNPADTNVEPSPANADKTNGVDTASPTDGQANVAPANAVAADPMPAKDPMPNVAEAADNGDAKPEVVEPKPAEPPKPLAYDPLFDLPRLHRTSVVFAPQGQPFVALDWDVYDLDARKRVGGARVRVAERYMPTQISPDGILLAVSKRLTRGWSIPLYSAKSGRKVDDMILDDDTRPSLRLMQFVDKKTLLCIYRSQIVNWSLESYRVRERFRLKLAVETGKVAFSVDGQRVAVATKEKLLILSCESGKVIVTAALPPDPAADPFAECRALSFSPTGDEFACWLDDRLVIWNRVGDYMKIVRIPVEIKNNANSYHFQFLPNRRGWLVGGQYIVHRNSGQTVWKADFDLNYRNVPYRVTADGKIIRAIGNSLFGKLVTLEVPWLEIDDRLLQYAQANDPVEKRNLFPIVTDLKVSVSAQRSNP